MLKMIQRIQVMLDVCFCFKQMKDSCLQRLRVNTEDITRHIAFLSSKISPDFLIPQHETFLKF